jgi:hypothetical protein
MFRHYQLPVFLKKFSSLLQEIFSFNGLLPIYISKCEAAWAATAGRPAGSRPSLRWPLADVYREGRALFPGQDRARPGAPVRFPLS